MEFAINPFTGALTRVGTFVTSKEPVAGPVGISFDPSGRNAYVGNTGGIAQFRVNRATGALVGTNAMAASGNDAFLWGGVDPYGRFLFTAWGEVGPDGPYGTITWFAINGNGTLIPSGSVSLGASTSPTASRSRSGKKRS
jgi:hypothetical protein